MKQTTEQRFWSKVRKTNTCWEWTAAVSHNGYGFFKASPDKMVKAHRYAWEHAFGPIAAGLSVCHRCDNPRCVRVEHLFLGTAKDNAKDRQAKGRGAGLHHERHPSVVLDYQSVHEIRTAVLLGAMVTKVARLFGIKQSTVSAIVVGRNWTSKEKRA